jgi:hypothetical protein
MIQYQIWVKVETNIIISTVMKFFIASNIKVLRAMLIGMYGVVHKPVVADLC